MNQRTTLPGHEDWQLAGAILMATIYAPDPCCNVLTYRSKASMTEYMRQFLQASFLVL